MSRKNSHAEKQKRREERQGRRLNENRQANTVFYLVPFRNEKGEDGYRKVYGSCATCTLQKEINDAVPGQVTILQHECKAEFLTEEQMQDITETAARYMTLAQQEETDEEKEESTSEAE